MLNPESFIAAMRNADDYMEHIFMQGGCFQFYVILKTVFADAKPMMNKAENHVATRIGQHLYDINGKLSAKEAAEFTDMTESQFQTALDWRFSKHMMLAGGECIACGEPKLISKEELEYLSVEEGSNDI